MPIGMYTLSYSCLRSGPSVPKLGSAALRQGRLLFYNRVVRHTSPTRWAREKRMAPVQRPFPSLARRAGASLGLPPGGVEFLSG